MKSHSTARIKDIAVLAGVSIGTVDRVLHNRGEVASDTRERVLKIAEEMHYSPNLMARALKSTHHYRIFVLLPEATDENSFWLKHQMGLKSMINELAPYQVKLDFVKFDMQREESFHEKACFILEQEADGVVFAPIFNQESRLFCSELHKKHVPYVFVDSYVDDPNLLAYIGEDAYQSGRVAAQLIDYGTPVDKDILIVNIARVLENRIHLNNRTQGFLSYYLDAGKNKGLKISLEISSPNSEELNRKLDEVIHRNPNIGAIFVTSSKGFLVASYLESKGIRNLNLVGYDIVDKNVSYLRTGYIKYLIGQRPSQQTEMAVRKLFGYLLHSKVPNRMEYLPIDIITSENVTFFV